MGKVSLILKQWVLVKHVIEVSDLPFSNWFLVVHGQEVEEVEPSKISLELNNILDTLVIFRSEKNWAMVLVKDIKFHWAFNNAGERDKEWSVIHCIQDIEHMATVLLFGEWGVGVPLCSKDIVVLWNVVAFNRLGVLWSINAQTLVNFSFENFDWWLLYSKVGHLNIKSMEMDSVQAITNVAC